MVNSIDGYNEVKRGHYDINGKDCYFRSKWEANIALYLDFLKGKSQIEGWSFETKWFEFPIKHGTTRYLPDFEVTTKRGIEYWEVKGFMDSKSKTKLNRMQKYFPDIKLIVVGKKEYTDIKNIVGRMLKFY